MPNLVVYVPAGIWRALQKMEGAATPDVARAIAKEAIRKHVQASTPGGSAAPKMLPSGTSGTDAVTASSGSGVEILPPE